MRTNSPSLRKLYIPEISSAAAILAGCFAGAGVWVFLFFWAVAMAAKTSPQHTIFFNRIICISVDELQTNISPIETLGASPGRSKAQVTRGIGSSGRRFIGSPANTIVTDLQSRGCCE